MALRRYLFVYPNSLLAVWIAVLCVTEFAVSTHGAKPTDGRHQAPSPHRAAVPAQCGCGPVHRAPLQLPQIGPGAPTAGAGGSQRSQLTPQEAQNIHQYPHIKVLYYNMPDGHIETVGVNGHTATAADAATCRGMHAGKTPVAPHTCAPNKQHLLAPGHKRSAHPQQQAPGSCQMAPFQNAAHAAPPNSQPGIQPPSGIYITKPTYAPIDLITVVSAWLLALLFVYCCLCKASKHWRKYTRKLRRLPASLTVCDAAGQTHRSSCCGNMLVGLSRPVYQRSNVTVAAAAAIAAYTWPSPWMLGLCITFVGVHSVIFVWKLIIGLMRDVSLSQLLRQVQSLMQCTGSCIGGRCIWCIGSVASALQSALSWSSQHMILNASQWVQQHAANRTNSIDPGVTGLLQQRPLISSSSSSSDAVGEASSNSNKSARPKQQQQQQQQEEEEQNAAAETTKLSISGSRGSSYTTTCSTSSSSISSPKLVRRCISDPTDACRLTAAATDGGGPVCVSPCSPAAAGRHHKQQRQQHRSVTPATSKPKQRHQHQQPPPETAPAVATPDVSPAKSLEPFSTASSAHSGVLCILDLDTVSSRSKRRDQSTKAAAAAAAAAATVRMASSVHSPGESGSTTSSRSNSSSSSSSKAGRRDQSSAAGTKPMQIHVLHKGTPFAAPQPLQVNLGNPTTASSSSSSRRLRSTAVVADTAADQTLLGSCCNAVLGNTHGKVAPAAAKVVVPSFGSSSSGGSSSKDTDALSPPATPGTPTTVPDSFLMLANSSSSSSYLDSILQGINAHHIEGRGSSLSSGTAAQAAASSSTSSSDGSSSSSCSSSTECKADNSKRAGSSLEASMSSAAPDHTLAGVCMCEPTASSTAAAAVRSGVSELAGNAPTSNTGSEAGAAAASVQGNPYTLFANSATPLEAALAAAATPPSPEPTTTATATAARTAGTRCTRRYGSGAVDLYAGLQAVRSPAAAAAAAASAVVISAPPAPGAVGAMSPVSALTLPGVETQQTTASISHAGLQACANQRTAAAAASLPDLYGGLARSNTQQQVAPNPAPLLAPTGQSSGGSSSRAACAAFPANGPAAAPALARPPVRPKVSPFNSAAAAIAAIAAGGASSPPAAVATFNSSSSSCTTLCEFPAEPAVQLPLTGDGFPAAAAAPETSSNINNSTTNRVDNVIWSLVGGDPSTHLDIPPVISTSAPLSLMVSSAMISPCAGSLVQQSPQQLSQQLSGKLSVETANRLLPNDLFGEEDKGAA